MEQGGYITLQQAYTNSQTKIQRLTVYMKCVAAFVVLISMLLWGFINSETLQLLMVLLNNKSLVMVDSWAVTFTQ